MSSSLTQGVPLAIKPPRRPLWQLPFVLLLVALLRVSTTIARITRKIVPTCPWCRQPVEPLYRCPACDQWHEQLSPTDRGVWTQKCACGHALATTDSGGRAAYARRCSNPDCGKDWPAEGPGFVSEFHLAIVGRPSGLLPAAVLRLVNVYATANQITICFLDPEEAAACQKVTTANGEPRQVTLLLEPHGQPARLLYLYDRTNVTATCVDTPAHLDGVLYLIELSQDTAGRAMPETICQGRPFDLPLALIVKCPTLGPLADALPKLRDLSGTYASAGVAAQEAERDSAAIRLALVKLGLGDLANALEARFGPVACFAVSPDEQVHGALAPLIWLCHQAGTLPDVAGAAQGWANLWRFFRLALAGREGPRAANVARGLIVFGGPVALLLIGLIFGWQALGLAFLGTLGLAAWYAWRR